MASTMPVVIEIVKWIMSLIFFRMEKNYTSFSEPLRILINIPFKDHIRYLVPGLIYAISNRLIFVVLSLVPVPVFQLL